MIKSYKRKPQASKYKVFRGLAVAGMIVVDNPGSDGVLGYPAPSVEWLVASRRK
jgi:hypothetical protein